VKNGPYDSEPAARAASLWAQSPRREQIGSEALNQAQLATALGPVELGDFDKQIFTWLSQQSPAAVAVICGWLARVQQGGPR
jgi:hypothetical protein